MSTVKNQTDISGMLGEIVSVRKVSNRLVVTNRPKRKMGKPSDKQELVQEKFYNGSRYAKQQIAIAESRELYATGITPTKRTPYLVAMNDYLTGPKVASIDTNDYHGSIGDIITVAATDDFMVTKVKIKILNAAGVLIEDGEAMLDLPMVGLWGYKAKVANAALSGTTIRATAYDRPGNTGSAEVVME